MRNILLSIGVVIIAIFAAFRLLILDAEWSSGMPAWPQQSQRSDIAKAIFSLEITPESAGLKTSSQKQRSIIVFNGVGEIIKTVITQDPSENDNWFFEEYLQSDINASGALIGVRKRHIKVANQEQFDILKIEPSKESILYTCNSTECDVGPIRWSPEGNSIAFIYRINRDLLLGVIDGMNNLRNISLGSVGGWALNQYHLGWNAENEIVVYRPAVSGEPNSIIVISPQTRIYSTICSQNDSKIGNTWELLQQNCKDTDLSKIFGDMNYEFDSSWLSSDGKYSFSFNSKEALVYTRWIEGVDLQTGAVFLTKKLPIIFPYLP